MKLEKAYLANGIGYIPLTKGMWTRVSQERFKELVAFEWYASWAKNVDAYYAVRGKSRRLMYMHRQILGLTSGEPTQGDHKNGDTLDNTNGNLRPASRTQQQGNKETSCNNTSGYKGVSWSKWRGMWRAYICRMGKQKHLGYFANKEDAYAAYCAAAHEYFGEFARVA